KDTGAHKRTSQMQEEAKFPSHYALDTDDHDIEELYKFVIPVPSQQPKVEAAFSFPQLYTLATLEEAPIRKEEMYGFDPGLALQDDAEPHQTE
ncbi:unnamed protein product, partial [Symbiodinium pilosum]